MRLRFLLVGAAELSRGEGGSRLKAASRKADFVIAVDGGYRELRKAGVVPDLFVGDADSLAESPRSARVPGRVPSILLDPRKDFSDLAAALRAVEDLVRLAGAAAQDCELEARGVLGGRIDHHWASLQVMGAWSLKSKVGRIMAVHGAWQAHWVHRDAPFLMTLGPAQARRSIVSLFAVGGPARGVVTRGLEYALKGETLDSGSRGLSNRPSAARISVKVKSGLVLLMHGPERHRELD